MKEKLQTFFIFLFSVSLLPYIGYIIAGKIDFLSNDLKFTDYHLSLIKTATIITYINVACLIAIAIYTLYWSKKRPVLFLSAIFFLFRIPWLLRLFSSFGISSQIVSDVFTFGFMLFLILYAYLKKIPPYLKTLNGFTLLSGFFNCSVGISSGIYFTIYPSDYSDWVRIFFIKADIVSWGIFGALLVINMFLIHFHISYKQFLNKINERNLKLKESKLLNVKQAALPTISPNISAIASISESSGVVARNSFVKNKLENFSTDLNNQVKYLDYANEDFKKPIKIPRITRKDQIHWICEDCGLSNPYFLSKCKECDQERPGILYDEFNPVIISKNAITAKFSIVHVITDHWQTLEGIANKMGINNERGREILRKKLTNLVKVNYLIPNSTGTMFRLNNFEM